MSIASLRLAVLDSSVVVKWFREGERLGSEALGLRSAYLNGTLDLAVPDLLIYEVANALCYKADLPTDVVEAAVQSLYDMNVAIIPVTADLARRAAQLARRYDVTVYDAAFVACADHVGASLITADEAFFHKMNSHPSVMYLGDLAVTPAP